MKTKAKKQAHKPVKTASSRNKKQQIVEAAIKVFLKQGYAETTLARVAEEANVIRATIYSHFKNKEELFIAIIEELTINRFNPDFEQKLMTATPKQFVYMLRDVVNFRRQDKEYLSLLRTVLGESERFPELTRLYSKTIFSRIVVISQKFFENHPELPVKSPLSLALVIGGSMMSYLIQQELLYGKEVMPVELDDVADTIAELLRCRKLAATK